ncbi:organic cation transporter protein-like [Physella acuta]|uniref:organic cation transporter protein-like n=1 Tax=Physella acuta TaxID=109671 RepID=UPI0027DDF4F0|nr:organic cation transporter protein-like [Physella acuta]
MIINLFFGFGVLLLPVLAFYLRHWRSLQLAASSWTFIFVIYYWLIPESPRWLITKERYGEAEIIIQRAAIVNKTKVPDAYNWEERVIICEPFRNIFVHRVLAIRTSIIYANWAVCSMNYYGLSLNATRLTGSVYVNTIIFALVEISSYLCSYFFLECTGRKVLHIIFMALTGVFCMLSPFPQIYGGSGFYWLTILLATVGKFGASGAYANIWLYSAELFPTVLRSCCMSSGSFFARIGGMIAPYVANFSSSLDRETAGIIPLIVFGVVSIIAGAFSYSLPETRDTVLPETIAEALALGRTPKYVQAKEKNVSPNPSKDSTSFPELAQAKERTESPSSKDSPKTAADAATTRSGTTI